MKPTDSFLVNLGRFTSLVESHSNARQRVQYNGVLPDESVCTDKPGSKFVRVYFKTGSSRSVRYFVRIADGAIFAANSWKVPNLNRQFGTFDTMNEFEWGGYEGVAKPDSRFKMKPVGGGSGYQTAVLK